MKTLEELYKEVMADENLKKEFLEFAKNKNLQEFMKKYDCKASKEELESFLKAKFEKKGELEDKDLLAVSGGCTSQEIKDSIESLGLYCLFMAIFG